jgi:hypothetical protein
LSPAEVQIDLERQTMKKKKMLTHEALCEELLRAWGFMIEAECIRGKLELTAFAPVGKYFATEGLHTLVECQTDEPDDEVWARLHERILDGFAECRDGGCNGDCELAMLS